MEKMNYIDGLMTAKNDIEVDALVTEYLRQIGQDDASRGETYEETSYRLGGDDVMDTAATRWYELRD